MLSATLLCPQVGSHLLSCSKVLFCPALPAGQTQSSRGWGRAGSIPRGRSAAWALRGCGATSSATVGLPPKEPALLLAWLCLCSWAGSGRGAAGQSPALPFWERTADGRGGGGGFSTMVRSETCPAAATSGSKGRWHQRGDARWVALGVPGSSTAPTASSVLLGASWAPTAARRAQVPRLPQELCDQPQPRVGDCSSRRGASPPGSAGAAQPNPDPSPGPAAPRRQPGRALTPRAGQCLLTALRGLC